MPTFSKNYEAEREAIQKITIIMKNSLSTIMDQCIAESALRLDPRSLYKLRPAKRLGYLQDSFMKLSPNESLLDDHNKLLYFSPFMLDNIMNMQSRSNIDDVVSCISSYSCILKHYCRIVPHDPSRIPEYNILFLRVADTPAHPMLSEINGKIVKFYENEDYRELAIYMRLAIEYMLAQHICHGKYFEELDIASDQGTKINKLFELGCIDESEKIKMHTIRKLGNNLGAHLFSGDPDKKRKIDELSFAFNDLSNLEKDFVHKIEREYHVCDEKKKYQQEKQPEESATAAF